MEKLFADLPEAIANTNEVSSRLEFTLADLGYEFPRYPVPEGETMMSFLRQRTEEGFQRALRAGGARPAGAGAAAGGARAGADRKTSARRIFPDRVGHRALLPRAGNSGPGTRLGGQQRGVLLAGNHGGRSGGNGFAVRALPQRRARRVAGHRSRSALGRPARARHPVRLPALWRARRGHDRQRDHLSRAHGGARDGQGARLRRRHGRAALRGWWEPGSTRTRTTRWKNNSAMPASICVIRACGNFWSCAWRCRTCRATWGSTPAAW